MLRWQLFNIKNFPSSAQITEPLHRLKSNWAHNSSAWRNTVISEPSAVQTTIFFFWIGTDEQLSLSDNVHRLFPEMSLRPLQLQCPGCACTAWCTPAPVTGISTADSWPGSHSCQWHICTTMVTARLPTQTQCFSCGPSSPSQSWALWYKKIL